MFIQQQQKKKTKRRRKKKAVYPPLTGGMIATSVFGSKIVFDSCSFSTYSISTAYIEMSSKPLIFSPYSLINNWDKFIKDQLSFGMFMSSDSLFVTSFTAAKYNTRIYMRSSSYPISTPISNSHLPSHHIQLMFRRKKSYEPPCLRLYF